MFSPLADLEFNNIWVVQDRNHWQACKARFQPKVDLVLVVDTGLYMQLKSEGHRVEYFGRFLDRHYVQELNIHMHDFIRNWYRDKEGNDLLVYEGQYPMGDAFLLSILSEVTFFGHFYTYFLHIGKLKSKAIFVAVEEDLRLVFEKTGLSFESIAKGIGSGKTQYLFPIKQWMADAIKPKGLKASLKRMFTSAVDYICLFLDSFEGKKKRLFIQEHHPTRPIIAALRSEGKYRIINSDYSGLKGILGERRILYRNFSKSVVNAEKLLKRVKQDHCQTWVMDGQNHAAHFYEIIFRVLEEELQTACDAMESIHRYFKKRQLSLMVPITDLWMKNRLIMSYCKQHHIPVFLVINGLMGLSFWREAKDADYVNCFGQSTHDHYFMGAERALTLGDPRMDHYVNQGKKEINRTNPVVVVGTSGFNLLDLNSFLAVEYDFIYEVLSALNDLVKKGRKMDIRLKVRPNGYVQAYRDFAAEFFPNLKITYYQSENFSQVVSQADLYISFYSQTLFEASQLGIPAIYFKNDRQILHPPFDGSTPLVTAEGNDELIKRVTDFYEGEPIFEAFQQPELMQEFIGALDGKNTQRNVEFIEELTREE